MPCTQMQMERIGTAYFLRKLYDEGIKVAIPDIDDGVDLVAYLDREQAGFRAVPIQLKCFGNVGFNTEKKYLKIPGLRIAYIWHLESEINQPRFFLMNYQQAEDIVDDNNWSRLNGRYARTRHSTTLENALAAKHGTDALLKDILFP